MRFLLNAKTSLHAQLVQGALEDAGIPAIIEVSPPRLGSLGKVYGFTGGVGVYVVRDDDYEAAVRIALQYGRQPSHCETCGYDLRGLPEPRCPECGTLFTRPPSREPWKCPNCGEEIEGQFTDCWKCGAARDSTTAGDGGVQDPRLRARCHFCLSDDAAEIDDIRQTLTNAGIQSIVCGLSANEIWLVDADGYPRAREAIAFRSLRSLHCSRCGYDLAGLRDLRCPECGKPFGPSWICPACGGENTEEFMKCCRCLADRPVSEAS